MSQLTMLAWLLSLTFILHTSIVTSHKHKNCNHYHDKPINICFSSSSTKGLKSYKYICATNSSDSSILFQTYNKTNACEPSKLINSTLLYNLTEADINATYAHLYPYETNPFISCRSTKSCPYFKGRYYITKILTDAPTADPTSYPSTNPTPSPSNHPTVINGTLYPSPSPTKIPTISPTNIPSFTPTVNNYTSNPSITPTLNPINWGPYFPNETCAKTELNGYYQENVYVIDICIPVYKKSENVSISNFLNKTDANMTYISHKCNKNPFGVPLTIESTLFMNETCNNSMIDMSKDNIYDSGMCYNTTNYDYMLDDIKYISYDSERDYYKFFILNCDYLIDIPSPNTEYLFYEFDLIASWIIFILSSLMLLIYTFYIMSSCRRVQKRQKQYNETGILVLDDNFSESRLAVLIFQWFALFTLWLNAMFNFINSWSVVELRDADQCNLVMSALDLTWHWGKGFFYISLMSRIVLIMEGLSDKYVIPPKILKIFAFEIVAYFMLTPILDLVTTRADHRLYEFEDERKPDELVFVCGEIIEYWISFLLLFGDLLLCSTTIGVYLYALGELIIEPIKNQKLVDMVIRYCIFSVFSGVFIMIGNGIWSTNNFSIARYIDSIFVIFSLMLMLSVCTSCYLQCCSNCHRQCRHKHIRRFLEIKHKYIEKEFRELANNPKYILKSYDTEFDQKLTQILSHNNLVANESLDRYHQNVALHHANSSIKSKRKLKKVKKKLRKQFSSLKRGESVKLNSRDLQTMHKLLSFRSIEKFRDNQQEKLKFAESKNQYLVHDDDTNNMSKSRHKKRLKRKNTLKNAGLLAQLNPIESKLPTSLAIAIHSSVVETAQKVEDEHLKELMDTDAYKIRKKWENVRDKCDTYWDENQILFPRRSPTIYPGTAYKLSKKEKFALDQRTGELNEFSDTDDHSDSADSEDYDQEFQTEQKWPKPSRKYGHSKNLDQIYTILSELNKDELDTIWRFFDEEKKGRIDYKTTLVKLLGAFFLLYFRKKIFGNQAEDKNNNNINLNDEHKENMNYISLEEQPPGYDELEPLLIALTKYIRDYLRKKHKRFLKKNDYQKNIKKYLKYAIEKRSRLISNRNTKLQKQTTMLSLTGQSDTLTTTNNTFQVTPGTIIHNDEEAEDTAFLLSALNHIENYNDNKEEEFEEKQQELSSRFRDDAAAQIELQKMMNNYIPRESSNKYTLLSEFKEEKIPEKKMKIDFAREKRESQRKLFGVGKREKESSHKKQNSSLLLDKHTKNVLQAIQDNKPMPMDNNNDNDEDGIDVDDILIEIDDKNDINDVNNIKRVKSEA
eukprot:181376_1